MEIEPLLTAAKTCADKIVERWLGPFLLAIFAALAPIHSVLLVVGILIIGDLILGIWAAFKRGEEISSSGLRDTVTKLFVYNMVIVLGFIVQNHLVDLPFVKVSASLIGIVEIKSVFENASDILGKPIFKEVLKKLGSKNRL